MSEPVKNIDQQIADGSVAHLSLHERLDLVEAKLKELLEPSDVEPDDDNVAEFPSSDSQGTVTDS